MRAALLRAALGAALLASACSPDPRAWAGRVESRTQLIGGPRALGEVGDYRIHNNRVRFIVQDVGSSRGFGTFGGSLIDADLVRADERYDPYADKVPGRDGLAELFPAFFLSAIEPTQVKVDDGSGNGVCDVPVGTACIRVLGKTSEFLTATTFLDSATLGSGLLFSVDYKLGPTDDFLTITASVTNGQSTTHDFPIGKFPIPFGFIALFGDGQPLFLDGEAGYDIRFSLERSYKRPYKLPAFPGVTANIVAAEGDGVSYGLTFVPDQSGGYVWKHRDQYGQYGTVTPWSMLVPFVSGSFVGVYMAEPPASIAGGHSFSYTARLRLSDGSSAAVIDGLLRDTAQVAGTLTGIVREERSELPVPYADVVVLQGADPKGPAVTTAKADAAGRFIAKVPPGSYTAIGRLAPRPNAPALPFNVTADQVTYLEPHVGRTAIVAVDIVDEAGRRVPAKVTVDAPYGVEHAGQDPKSFLYDLRIGDPYRPTDLVPDTDDPETRRYVEGVFRAVDGRATGEVRPGKYRVTVSRGPAYSIDTREDVEMKPGEVTRLSATVRRVLPANGRIAADLHVHSIASIDSDVTFEDRLLGYAAEGVDFLAATDHNFVVDYQPLVARMGLQDFVQTTTGIELTSLEAGHWNAYPLNYPVGPVRHFDLDWFRKKPQTLFDGLRGLGRYGPDDTVVQVNHPRDATQGYFTAYGLIGDSLTNEQQHDTPPRTGTFVPQGPGFQFGDFSLDFDAVEILTGKRFDLMRTYRVPQTPPPAPVPPPCPQPSGTACMGPPGSIVRDANGAVAFPGAYEDWQHLLDAGRRITAVGNSDSHKTIQEEAGYPRNLIDLGHGWDAATQIDEREVARAIKAGRVMVTTAPEITLTGIDASTGAEVGPGQLVHADDAGVVRVHVVIKAAPWVDVTRAALILPGGQRVALPVGAIAADGVTRLDVVQRVRVPDGRDSWIAAECTGDRSLYPVVVPYEIPPLLLNDAVNSVGAAIGLKDDFGNLKPTQIAQTLPFALSNPLLVDGDGDGQWGLPRPSHAVQPLRTPARPAALDGEDARPLDLRKVFRDWAAH
jgi:hypothetical protein